MGSGRVGRPQPIMQQQLTWVAEVRGFCRCPQGTQGGVPATSRPWVPGTPAPVADLPVRGLFRVCPHPDPRSWVARGLGGFPCLTRGLGERLSWLRAPSAGLCVLPPVPRQLPLPASSCHQGDILQERRWWLTGVHLPPGYSLVTHIPAGARDIQIVERKKSADVLGELWGSGQCLGVGKGCQALDTFPWERGGPAVWPQSQVAVAVGDPGKAGLPLECRMSVYSELLDREGVAALGGGFPAQRAWPSQSWGCWRWGPCRVQGVSLRR